ncbi:MAG: GHMP kinase, partial [Candidatus Bathyarchaeia archaeon]
MRESSAFAPGHLTGFFQICDEAADPKRRGSRGAGFSTTLGVHTTVKVERAARNSVTIAMNGEVTPAAFVSENVARRMLSALDRPHRVRVDHLVETPIGAGFGSSGGGALSLALALNEALGLGLTRIETAQVAHLAEIDCGTGLGTVIAEFAGGFGVLVEPGAPGIGRTVKFGHSGLVGVCLPFGPIPTRDALADPALRRRINELGGRFVDELQRSRDPELFMQLSRRFAEHVGLI